MARDGGGAWIQDVHVQRQQEAALRTACLEAAGGCAGGVAPARFEGDTHHCVHARVCTRVQEISEAYGVLSDEGIALRGLFIIDKEGVVQVRRLAGGRLSGGASAGSPRRSTPGTPSAAPVSTHSTTIMGSRHTRLPLTRVSGLHG